jgi:hypothetical protein
VRTRRPGGVCRPTTRPRDCRWHPADRRAGIVSSWHWRSRRAVWPSMMSPCGMLVTSKRDRAAQEAWPHRLARSCYCRLPTARLDNGAVRPFLALGTLAVGMRCRRSELAAWRPWQRQRCEPTAALAMAAAALQADGGVGDGSGGAAKRWQSGDGSGGAANRWQRAMAPGRRRSGSRGAAHRRRSCQSSRCQLRSGHDSGTSDGRAAERCFRGPARQSILRKPKMS